MQRCWWQHLRQATAGAENSGTVVLAAEALVLTAKKTEAAVAVETGASVAQQQLPMKQGQRLQQQ